jgi:hypothetical protein
MDLHAIIFGSIAHHGKWKPNGCTWVGAAAPAASHRLCFRRKVSNVVLPSSVGLGQRRRMVKFFGRAKSKAYTKNEQKIIVLLYTLMSDDNRNYNVVT